jgi:hypothetical protein
VFDEEGDASCLKKVANGFGRLLQSSTQSYYHAVRVLAQLCSISRALHDEFNLAINDPSRGGVTLARNRTKVKRADSAIPFLFC